tara:strand:+ start:12375 stop:12512 length:138 start_codon:yes stop_codon:yes gene_type:complete
MGSGNRQSNRLNKQHLQINTVKYLFLLEKSIMDFMKFQPVGLAIA